MTHQLTLFLSYLDAYASYWLQDPSWFTEDLDAQRACLAHMRRFAQSAPTVFSRSHLSGHFTGSALVVDESLDHVLLTLHAKLDLWLQLGGHADGDANIAQVAMREAEEESGMSALRFFPYEASLARVLGITPSSLAAVPFDLDIHRIPARPQEPEHDHLDVRFLIVADRQQALAISHESKDLRWFSWREAFQCTAEHSMHRQFRKVMALKESIMRPSS